MAIELSVEAQAFLDQTNIVGNIVLEIDGFPNLYGSIKVTKLARIGEFIIGDGTIIGGSVEDENSKDLISVKEGTTRNINQKLEQDRGGSSSITSFTVRMIDKNSELTRDFSPGVVVEDILGNLANVYWQANGSKFPEDATRLIVGVVSSVSLGAGFVDVRVDSPNQLARQDLLPKASTQLTDNLPLGVTACLVESTEAFTSPQENLELYIRVNDEIIKVNGFSSSGFQNLDRAQFGTIEAPHETGDEVESFYRLQGETIELSLRMLLSDPNEESFAEETFNSVNQLNSTVFVQDSIFFPVDDIQDKYGLVVGDLVAITEGADPSNLTGFTEIISFGKTSNGSYLVLNKELLTETDISGKALFKSKYNKLSFGAGLKPFQVDVENFERIETEFGAQFFDYDYFIKDTINAKEFIEEKILYPSGCFGLPRKGRVSLGISAPPLVGPLAKTISAQNVTNAEDLRLSRSINERFYNSIVYKFNENASDERFLSAITTLSQTSVNRIKIGNRTLEIEAGGIRDTPENRIKIENISTRFLDRYQFGAESIDVNLNFKTMFSIEPGDTVILDGSELRLSDITQGSRNFITRVMEVQNISRDLISGNGSASLVDVNQSTRKRYASISPSSLTGPGSSPDRLIIKRSFSTGELELERDKWSDYLVQRIQVRNEDYTEVYETNLIEFDPSNPNALRVNPPLPLSVGENYIIECPVYDETDQTTMSYWKGIHAFWNPQVSAISGDFESFEVDPSDVGKFYEGAPLDIHTEDYTQRAQASVSNVAGNIVTINSTLGFQITNSFLIDLIGFGDEGAPYSWY